MIYNSTVTALNEADVMSVLESVEDRFENYTMAEATAITLGEQEENWTRFMKGVGLSELATVMEGQEVIYEGARLTKFIEKAKGYFKMALNKLAEITKSFINKVAQFVTSNNQFIKRYEKQLNDLKNLPSDLEISGYTFKGLAQPKYPHEYFVDINNVKTLHSTVVNNKDNYSREKAEDVFVKGANGDSFSEKLNDKFFGGKKENIKIDKSLISSQITILKDTKNLKSEAKKSYTNAAKEIKDMIKQLEKAQKEEMKNFNKDTDINKAGSLDEAFNIVISFWKAYASAAHQTHGTYMRALGTRARQAKAICTKALNASGKATGKAERKEIKAKMEGFADTDVFLGGVEFI